MDEKDLQLAKAMVEEEKDQCGAHSGSYGTAKKTTLNKVMEKMNAFR